MKLEVARYADSPELVQFFKEFPVEGKLQILCDRKEDFYGPYKIQSEDFQTYVLKNPDDKKIHGVASFVFQTAQLDGIPKKIAYAKDLRVSHHRRAILNWSHHFLPVLEQIKKNHQVDYLFSTINLDDQNTLNAFIRPRPMKRPFPRYHLYRKFRMVSLHGQFPWAHRPLESIKVRPCSESLKDELLFYLIRRLKHRHFSLVFDEASFVAKIKRLVGMTLNDLLVATDSQNKVVGCLAPWSSKHIQDFYPLHYNLLGHNFRQFLKFAWILGMTRRLAKPVRFDQEKNISQFSRSDEPLSFHYLTFCMVDNEDIFESLLYAAYEKVGPKDFLLYAHNEADFRLKPPKSWIAAEMPYAIYSIVHPTDPIPDILNMHDPRNPDIEAAFI